MKVKIPVTNSIIGKLNGASVEEVHTVTNVGHLSPAKVVKENPGFTVIKQSKTHAVANIPDEIISQYAVLKMKKPLNKKGEMNNGKWSDFV